MTTDRIKEIQQATAHPESVSVQQALLKVWNECEQEQLRIGAVLPVVRLSMEGILRDAVRRQATYQVQFADYDLDTWTAPCRLTENRMEKLLDDGSIRKVRLELEM